MSIKNRLIASNIAMIVIPFILFILFEILMATLFFGGTNGTTDKRSSEWFMNIRLVGFLLIMLITNGILSYYVSKTILKPVRMLTEAAEEISKGNLDQEIKTESTDELGKLAETFEDMRIQLKKAKEERAEYENNRKEFIASISHDLKTPLTSIKGYIKGILDGIAASPDTNQRYLQTAYQKADEVDLLIDELFLYSKLDLNKLPFEFESIDLKRYFEDYLEELQYDSSIKDVKLTYSAMPNGDYTVKADRLHLGRVIDNIIRNSVKFMDKDEKKITVSIQSLPNKVLVIIADNGKGISSESLSRIFDSFYRADPSRNKATGGSGLGLAIVKKIIEGHNGEIWAESTEGKGTSIYFSLNKSEKQRKPNA